MKDKAFDLIVPLHHLVESLPDVKNGIVGIDDLVLAKLYYQDIVERELGDPDLFFGALRASMPDDGLYEHLASLISGTMQRYCLWYETNERFIRQQTSFENLNNLINTLASEKFDKTIADSKAIFNYVANADMAVIRPFTRNYGFLSAGGHELTEDEQKSLIPYVKAIHEYFAESDIKIPKDMGELYMWFETEYKPMYLRLRREMWEASEAKESYINTEWKHLEREIYTIIYRYLIQFIPTGAGNVCSGTRKRGEHGTPKNVQSFRECFISEEVFEAFMKASKEYSRTKEIKGNDASEAWKYLDERLRDGISKSRFLAFFHRDFPDIYTRASNTNVCSAKRSEFVENVLKPMLNIK